MAITVAIGRGSRSPSLTPSWAVAIVVMLAGLVVTTSRSGARGWLAGAVTVVDLSVPPRFLRAAAGLAVAAFAGAVVVILASPLRALNDDPPQLRLHLWQDAVRMIGARPVTGWGEDTTGLAFGQFLSQDYAGLVTFDRVHSGVLEIAATQGLLGLAALTWVAVVLAREMWRGRSQPGIPGLVGALVGYSVWVLFNFDWAPATGAFWLLTGTLWSFLQAPPLPSPTPGEGGPAAKRPGRMGGSVWQPALAVILAVAAVVLAVFPVLADVWYLKGRANLSVRVDPLQAQYHWALGTVPELQHAADLGETDPAMYIALGDGYAKLGQHDRAARAYGRALEIDPFYAPAAQRLKALGA